MRKKKKKRVGREGEERRKGGEQEPRRPLKSGVFSSKRMNKFLGLMYCPLQTILTDLCWTERESCGTSLGVLYG